jgi:hypothetical protein
VLDHSHYYRAIRASSTEMAVQCMHGLVAAVLGRAFISGGDGSELHSVTATQCVVVVVVCSAV